MRSRKPSLGWIVLLLLVALLAAGWMFFRAQSGGRIEGTRVVTSQVPFSMALNSSNSIAVEESLNTAESFRELRRKLGQHPKVAKVIHIPDVNFAVVAMSGTEGSTLQTKITLPAYATEKAVVDRSGEKLVLGEDRVDPVVARRTQRRNLEVDAIVESHVTEIANAVLHGS